MSTKFIIFAWWAALVFGVACFAYTNSLLIWLALTLSFVLGLPAALIITLFRAFRTKARSRSAWLPLGWASAAIMTCIAIDQVSQCVYDYKLEQLMAYVKATEPAFERFYEKNKRYPISLAELNFETEAPILPCSNPTHHIYSPSKKGYHFAVMGYRFLSDQWSYNSEDKVWHHFRN
jgi:hypothetical protein